MVDSRSELERWSGQTWGFRFDIAHPSPLKALRAAVPDIYGQGLENLSLFRLWPRRAHAVALLPVRVQLRQESGILEAALRPSFSTPTIRRPRRSVWPATRPPRSPQPAVPPACSHRGARWIRSGATKPRIGPSRPAPRETGSAPETALGTIPGAQSARTAEPAASTSAKPNREKSRMRIGYRMPSRWSHSCCTTRAWNPSTSRSIGSPCGVNPR